VCGGIGSGKSLTIVKERVDRYKQKAFVNFKLTGIPSTRLKYEHLFKQVVETNDKGKESTKMKLNFAFWNKQTKTGGFDIYLDEFHNVMSSRRSMSKKNILLSDWLSQVRKILGQTEKNNLYLITQKVKRIDVTSRDLAHFCILCNKETLPITMPTKVMVKGKLVTKELPVTIVFRRFFNDTDSLDLYDRFGVDTQCRPPDYFIGNPYYKYYDSYELIEFGTEEYV